MIEHVGLKLRRLLEQLGGTPAAPSMLLQTKRNPPPATAPQQACPPPEKNADKKQPDFRPFKPKIVPKLPARLKDLPSTGDSGA